MSKKTPPSRLVIPLLTLLAIVGTAVAARPASVLAGSLRSSKPSGTFFYIVSALNGSRYVDIQNGQTNPGKGGIPIIIYKKDSEKDSQPSDNQSWQFIPVKDTGGYGYFKSRSNLYLDIKAGSTASNTPVVAFTKDPSESVNQLWQLVSDGKNGKLAGYMQSKSMQGKKHLVLAIPGLSTTVNTPLIVLPQDPSLPPNQIWVKIPQPDLLGA